MKSTAWLRLFSLMFCLLAAVTPRAALSADIAIVGDTILFSGEIKAGDLSDLTKQVFKEQSLKPRQLTLSLNSNGNNFEEGILLSLFVKQSGIRTLVKNGNRCNSACALVFLGGTSNDGGEAGITVERNLEVGAELGFHMPFTSEQQQNANTQIQALNETEAILQLKRLFDTLEVPQAIQSNLMQNDAAHSLYDATTVEAVELLEINVEGLTVSPSHITRNMAFNGCLNGYRLANKQLPSAFANADLAALNATQSIMPVSRINTADDGFVLVPGRYGSGAEVLICRIGAGGECQGFYDQDAMAGNTIGYEQREDLNDCQRQSNVSILVPASTRLRDVDSKLVAMQSAEPALIATRPSTLLMPDIDKLTDEEAAENGDVSEDDAQLIPDIPEQSPQERFVVLPVQQRSEVICNAVQSFANVRSGPSGKLFPIVSTLPNQTAVTVIGNTKNPDSNHPWYEISFSGGRGFIDSELVQRSCLVALAPAVPAVAAVVPPPLKPQQRSVVVCNPKGGDSVNVRTSPNPKSSQIVRKMFNHERLNIIGEANNPESGQLYFHVEADGVNGYVDNEFVSAICNLPTQNAAPTRTSQYICNSKYPVTNMRTGPNADMFGVVFELQNNTAIEVLGPATNPVSGKPWLEISYAGNRGFVDASNVSSSCNVTPAALISSPLPDVVICNRDADFVNLRYGPNKDMFDVVAKVYNNQPVRILEETTNPVSGHPWLKVNVNGNVGFVDFEKVGPAC